MGQGRQSATRSYAHLNELCYRAVARALGVRPKPLTRDELGRYISRKETKSKEIRAELAAQNNASLEEAIAVLNRQTGEVGK